AAVLFLVVRYYEEAPPQLHADRPTSRPWAEVLRLPGLTGVLVVLFLVNFVGRSFTPILPLHLPSLGVPARRLASATGVLISVYSVAAALSAAGLGRASRRRSPRALLIASLVAGAATVLPIALVATFPLLV